MPAWLNAVKNVPPVPWPGRVPGPVQTITFEEDRYRKAFYQKAGKLRRHDRFESGDGEQTIVGQFVKRHMDLVQNEKLEFDEAFNQVSCPLFL